ncbi:alpha/beta fold hydrolase [Shimia sediminis]|uniref:alpha/beta fold hydrolase n=1 Tax=Shimia sediminis TaxID=2497945 RepID=UPI0013DE79ED|nr:alpha/beta hydrolase [Shimia sediminis]
MEQHGTKDAPAILLVRGLGSQLIHWPNSLIEGLVEKGFRVVTFDNRDMGLTQKFTEFGVPDIAELETKVAANEPVDVPYTLRNMSDDAIAVLDVCGIDKAHVMGISMGGGIVQHMALDHADRLLSATIVMSSSWAPDLPQAEPEVWELMFSQPASHSREDVIAHTLICDRAFGSPGYPFDLEDRSELIGRAFDRCYNPEGATRQYAAVIASRGRASDLGRIDLPVLVIHGTGDALLPIAHGRDVAARIPGAEFIEIEGMGHDLEGAVPGMIVEHVTRLAQSARN